MHGDVGMFEQAQRHFSNKPQRHFFQQLIAGTVTERVIGELGTV